MGLELPRHSQTVEQCVYMEPHCLQPMHLGHSTEVCRWSPNLSFIAEVFQTWPRNYTSIETTSQILAHGLVSTP